jgi:hypothetical protein
VKRPPELGSIEWVPLPDTDLVLGVRHVGPLEARRWSRAFEAHRRTEADRLRAAQRQRVADYGGDQAAAEAADPDLFNGLWASIEGDVDHQLLFGEMVGAAIAGVRGIEGLADTDEGEGQRALLYLPIDRMVAVIRVILHQQFLTPRQSFPAEGASQQVAPVPNAG